MKELCFTDLYSFQYNFFDAKAWLPERKQSFMRYQVYELAQFITCYKKHVGKFYHAVDLEKSKLCKITPRMDWMYYDDDGDDDDDDDDDELCMWYG